MSYYVIDSQAVVLALLERWESEGDGLEKHLTSVRGFYKAQRDAFMQVQPPRSSCAVRLC